MGAEKLARARGVSTGRPFRWMLRRRMVRDGLRAALTEDAFGLAALRIAVVAVLLVSPELHAAKGSERNPRLGELDAFARS